MACLILLNPALSGLDRLKTTVPSTNLNYLSEMENHLKSKAKPIVEEFVKGDYSVDLSLVLETAQTTTTTYIPGDKILVAEHERTENGATVREQKWELTGTWMESSQVHPHVRQIRCCVTLPKGTEIDHDHLYRRLSYELGIDLSRGDLLQIVMR